MATEYFSPELSHTTEKPTILMLYWDGFMEQSNGSQARAVEVLDYLNEIARVTVYSCANSVSDSPWTEAAQQQFADRFPGVRLLLETEGLPLQVVTAAKKLLVRMLPSSAKNVLGVHVPFAAPRLSQWVAEHPDALYFVHYVENVALINGIPWERTIIETHDLQYFRRAKVSGDLFSAKSLMRLRHEIATLAASAGIVSISQTEDYVYRNFAPNSQVFFVPMYKRPVRVDVPAALSYDFDLMFVGSSNVINRAGLVKLVADNAGWIGQYRIAVCGKVCEVPEIQQLAARNPNMSLLGFQDDLLPVYRQSKASISPTQGTGLNIKVLDALRHTKPVFATREAISALPPGSEGCVFNITQDKLASILQDSQALAEARRAAAAYFECFEGAGDLAKLDAFLRAAADRPRAAIAPK